MVAAAILDERPDADTLTPAQLVEAMAERGVTISQSTAQALLRELRSPLSTRMANRRPTREPRAPAPATAAARRPPRPVGPSGPPDQGRRDIPPAVRPCLYCP